MSAREVFVDIILKGLSFGFINFMYVIEEDNHVCFHSYVETHLKVSIYLIKASIHLVTFIS